MGEGNIPSPPGMGIRQTTPGIGLIPSIDSLKSLAVLVLYFRCTGKSKDTLYLQWQHLILKFYHCFPQRIIDIAIKTN